MKKIWVVIPLALGLALGIWNTSGKAQVEVGKDKKTKNKIRIQYLSEGQSQILAEGWIKKELQEYKQNNDSISANYLEGASLTPPTQYYNSRGRGVRFVYDIKQGDKFVGYVTVDAEGIEGDTLFSPYAIGTTANKEIPIRMDKTDARHNEDRVQRCKNKIIELVGPKAQLNGPTFYFFSNDKYDPYLVGFKDVKSGKLYLGELGFGRLLPESTTLQSLQKQHDEIFLHSYERKKQSIGSSVIFPRDI